MGCDGSSLEALRADLTLTPDDVAVVSWVGHETRLSFTATNAGRADLDIEPPLLAPVEGLDLLAGREVLDGTFLEVDSLHIGSASSIGIDVVMSPTVAGTSTLVLVVTPEDVDVAPASASIALEARMPPPCEARTSCETASFDPISGTCMRVPVAEGAPCSDGSACTESDRCSQGECLGVAVTCADDVACTIDACDPDVGCVFAPVHERCADDNPCTQDLCAPDGLDLVDGGCTSDAAPDGTLCGPFSCATLSTCFFGVCLEAPTPDGFPCEDGNLCTSGDRCAAQECVAGDPVAPAAQAPVSLARPTVHVEPDARWFPFGAPDDSTQREPIDVAARFGAVLDVDQGLVQGRPTLAVLWRSQPFDVDGAPCSPWDPLRVLATDRPGFCATALVVTFANEAELASDGGVAGGTSVVLDVIYGTIGAGFAPRDPIDDELHVLVAASTYLPSPEAVRQLRLTRATLSFAARDVVARTDEIHLNAPQSSTSTNVHAGLDVVIDANGNETFVGWDLPRETFQSTGADSAPPDPGDSGEPPVPPEPLAFAATLDVAAADFTWTALIDGSCETPPFAGGAGDASETMTWHDVDVTTIGDSVLVLVRRADPVLDACTSDALYLSGLELDGLSGASLGRTWDLGVEVRSAGVAEGTLAKLREPGAVLDIDCPAEAAPGACPRFTVEIDASAFVENADGVVTKHTFAIDHSEMMPVPVRVAALDGSLGVIGAIVVEREPDELNTGGVRVRLVDNLTSLYDVNAPLDLATEFFTAPPEASAKDIVKGLRSPLSPQRVYAVLPMGDDDGAVVQFGCPFPQIPTLP